MSKPEFDETQPFEAPNAPKPAFDETQPFQAGGQTQNGPGALATGLNVAGKALDYQRGVVGAPILAKLASLVSGKPREQLMSDQELSDAANPTTTRRAPNSDTILARAGVPSGPSASSVVPALYAAPGSGNQYSKWNPAHYWPEKGGMLDVTPRGAAGAALDMATDPLTYEMGGMSKAAEAAAAKGESTPLLSKVLNPASNVVEALGEHNYEKGLAPMIAKGEQFGKDVGDTYYRQGIYGTSKSIAKQGDKAAEALKASRDATMAAATEAGAKPSLSAAFDPLVNHLQELTADGRISHEDAMEILNRAIGAKGSVAEPTLAQMSQWKSDLSGSLPNSAFDKTKDLSMSKNMTKIAAGGNRDEVARAANAALPGAGDEINAANRDLGNLLTVQSVADKQAAREAGRKLVHPQDVGHTAIVGAEAGGGPAVATLLGRIGAATLNNPAFRTTSGYAMRKAGTGVVGAPVIDAASAEILRNMANKNQPVAGVGR